MQQVRYVRSSDHEKDSIIKLLHISLSLETSDCLLELTHLCSQPVCHDCKSFQDSLTNLCVHLLFVVY